MAPPGGQFAFEKPVVADLAESDGLVLHLSGRFWNAGQERLRQHVYEREQRLLSYPRRSVPNVEHFLGPRAGRSHGR